MNGPGSLHRDGPTDTDLGGQVLADPREEQVVDAPAREQVDAPNRGRHAEDPAPDDAGSLDGPQPRADIHPTADNVARHRTSVRVSGWATLGLIIGVVGLCLTLTGLLAPEGLAVGVIGIVVSTAGWAATRRTDVAGRGLAVLGMLGGLAAVALAVLAMTGSFSWPNSSTDQISRWNTWLVAHWHWLGRWS